MSKVKYTFSLEEETLQEMKILALRNKVPLNSLLVDLFNDYSNKIHELDEKYGLDKYGKKK
jgi:hypothetical protein